VRQLSGRRGSDSESYEVRGLPSVELLFQGAGLAGQVAPELSGSARRWRSMTPYLPVRHRKREGIAEYTAADVAAELRYRDLPPAVVALAGAADGSAGRWARGYRRYRMGERLRDARPGLALTLEFAEPVQGPLLLGQLSHFGYGIFQPE
jgi:CRISPR-associated protein Csb2